MSDYQRGNMPPIKKNALSEWKLRVEGPFLEGAKFPSALGLSVIQNQPRLEVFTNIQNAPNKGIIRGAMSTPDFYLFLDLVRQSIDAEPGTQFRMPNRKGHPKRMEHVSTSVVGKDKNGMVYITVTAEGQQKVKFTMGPSVHHAGLTDQNGDDIDPALVSRSFARGWVEMASKLVANVLDTHYTEPQPRNGGGGGGNRGYGGGGNGGGGGNRSYGGQGGGGAPQGGGDGGFDDFPM